MQVIDLQEQVCSKQKAETAQQASEFSKSIKNAHKVGRRERGVTGPWARI